MWCFLCFSSSLDNHDGHYDNVISGSQGLGADRDGSQDACWLFSGAQGNTISTNTENPFRQLIRDSSSRVCDTQEVTMPNTQHRQTNVQTVPTKATCQRGAGAGLSWLRRGVTFPQAHAGHRLLPQQSVCVCVCRYLWIMMAKQGE